jgi:hypothetical protein
MKHVSLFLYLMVLNSLPLQGSGTLEEIKAMTQEVFKNNSIINDDGATKFFVEMCEIY